MTIRNRLGNLRRDLLAPVHLQASLAELRRLLPATASGLAMWEVTQRFRGHGWYQHLSAWQVESEYCQLVDWVARKKPKVIVEIGTYRGGTLLAWSRIASQLVVSVDLPGGIHGGGYPPAKQQLYRAQAADRPGVEILVLQADSQSSATRDHVQAKLGDRKIDFLFIDGDHRYEGVARDFALWSPLVSPGGSVGFHDILNHPTAPTCEVDRLWNELKARFDSTEFIANANQGWGGVGLLHMPISGTRDSPTCP